MREALLSDEHGSIMDNSGIAPRPRILRLRAINDNEGIQEHVDNESFWQRVKNFFHIRNPFGGNSDAAAECKTAPANDGTGNPDATDEGTTSTSSGNADGEGSSWSDVIIIAVGIVIIAILAALTGSRK